MLLKILFSFDDAKVRRFSEPRNIFILFLFKNKLSFDINQVVVCEHTCFVCENNIF